MLSPKQLFLIDSIGAATTALLLTTLPFIWPRIFGLPVSITNSLSIPAAVFMVYSFLCFYYFSIRNWKRLLFGIALANLSYCLVSLFVIIKHSDSVSPIGWLYFIGELFIITGLAFYELKTICSKKN
jgi:hypothetical protein